MTYRYKQMLTLAQKVTWKLGDASLRLIKPYWLRTRTIWKGNRKVMNPAETGRPGLVSIVLTTLNGARYLREAVDSCLGQTYENIELIMIDGGSTDGTLDILATYDDPRMRIIHQENNVGKLPGAINLGLDNARGAYLTWMQDDSIYHEKAIEKMVAHLEANPKVGQVYADYWEIDAEGAVKKILQAREPEEFLEALGDPAGVCFMIRRSVREAVGPHDVTTYPSQDYDYRMRIALQFPSLHLREPLYSWRLHDISLTGRLGWVALARKDIEIRVKLGLATPQKAQRLLAEIDIAYAFECYKSNHYLQVPALVWSGLKRYPRYALNRGVWSILARSMGHLISSRAT
jgi:glycosyltransferase involved in cell wall biosynthesis